MLGRKSSINRTAERGDGLMHKIYWTMGHVIFLTNMTTMPNEIVDFQNPSVHLTLSFGFSNKGILVPQFFVHLSANVV